MERHLGTGDDVTPRAAEAGCCLAPVVAERAHPLLGLTLTSLRQGRRYQAAGHFESYSQPTVWPALCQQGSHSVTASATREERASGSLDRGLENADQPFNTASKSSKAQRLLFGCGIVVTVHNHSTPEAKEKDCLEFEVSLDYTVRSRLAWVIE